MLFKRTSLPADPARKLRSLTSERAVAWINFPSAVPEDIDDVQIVKDAWVIGTARYLALLGPDDQVWPWHLVDRVSWRPEDSRLIVTLTDGSNPLVITVTDKNAMKFLTLIRERVDHSVVVSETVDLTMSQTARIAVRRTATGDLIIQTIFDPGVDPNAVAVTRKIAPVIARLRDMSGAA